MTVSKVLHQTSHFTTLEKKISKLNQIWTKYKNTPSNVAFLVRDLTVLINTISTVDTNEFQSPRPSPVVAAALHECNILAQLLLDISGKQTSKFSRKLPNTTTLNHMELSFTDLKIRLLLLQFLVERREASLSNAAVAEELALLHSRTILRFNFDKSIEPKTDSLLSFKCYSELVGREKILIDIDAESEKSNIIVLAGPGGIGKTQIAGEHAIRFQNRNYGSHVFWVDCESSTSLEASYRLVAEKLRIPGADDYRTDILDKTRRYLEQEKTGKHLIILQNASASKWEPSSGVITLSPGRFPSSLIDFLPNPTKCQILCISSDARIATQLPGTPSILEVPALYDTEATSLFQSKIPKELDASGSASLLAKALDHLPLPICQAAAYMVATRCDAARYLQLLKGPFPRQYTTTLTESWYKTTSISYSTIKSQNPKAVDLLSLMSVCHRRAIPKNLLWSAWKHGLSDLMTIPCVPDFDVLNKLPLPEKVFAGERAAYIEFATALATLEAYLMVQYDAVNETYSMHRIVRTAILSILQHQETISTWRSSAMVLLSSISNILRLPIKQSARMLSTIMIHISEVAQHPHTTIYAGLAKAKVLCDAAYLKNSLGQYKESTALLKDAFQIQKGLLKPQDSRLLRTLFSLAESTSISDSAAAAIPLFTQSISGYKQIMGPGARRTLFAQLHLCSNHVTNGDIEAASTVLYETQAAASASLQISADDKQKIQYRVDQLKMQVGGGESRLGKSLKARPRSSLGDEASQKDRLKVLRQDGKRMSPRAFSSNNRVASLDSIVEIFEVEPGKS